MLSSPLPPFFLDTYSMLTSSMGCNALCMVVSFLVLWFICLNSLVHFRKGPEYLTSSTAQVIISLIRFLPDSFVSSNFLVLLSFISTCLMVSASRIPKYLFVSFYPTVLSLSRLGSSIPSVIYRLPLLIISIAHFSIPNSVPMPWMYILTAFIRAPISFSFFANSLMSST